MTTMLLLLLLPLALQEGLCREGAVLRYSSRETRYMQSNGAVVQGEPILTWERDS